MSIKIRTAALSGLLAATLMIPGSFAAAQDKIYDEDFATKVEAYLMDNPQVLIDALRSLEDKQRDQQMADLKDKVSTILDRAHSSDAPYIGNPDGSKKLAIFSDYSCPHCRRAHAEIKNLIASDDDIRVTIHEFPILGDASVMAARYALAVREISGPEGYAEVNDRIFSSEERMSETWIRSDAEDAGLSWEDIQEAMKSDAVLGQIEESAAMADVIGIQGTPFMILGDQPVPGAAPAETMRDILSVTN